MGIYARAHTTYDDLSGLRCKATADQLAKLTCYWLHCRSAGMEDIPTILKLADHALFKIVRYVL
jgi:hypothetical protein